MTKTCEICGALVTKVIKAIKCGHLIYLCEQCKKECPGALRECVKCER